MKSIIITIMWHLYALTLISQAGFRESNELIGHLSVRSTLSIGIADINGDFKDDVILLDKGTRLITGYQNGPGQAFRMVETGEILENPAWALSLGDINNDGRSELFTCGVSTYGNIFRQNPDGSYGFIQILYGLSFPQNSNMADINNDGFLDLFVCDERAYNDLYLNDGTGKMIYTDYIDMHTVPESDNSGNYGSEWVDFDDDRDIDLFITKCKPGIESPESPQRINVLYENNGNNQYSEQGAKWGLRNGDQSWTGSFGDLDNDGDLDCFVSNHDVAHIIYRNIENDTFVNVTEELGVPVLSASYEAAIRDFDNNGFMDIYVTGDRDFMYWNHGQDQWTIDPDPFGERQVFTFATGDLNDDGFLDLVTGYGRLNEAGDYDDVVWINEGNDNHFLKMSFLGEQSNLNGVGAKVKAYSPLGIQVRDVKIGESYGTNNSRNVHFGLGQVEMIDSLVIYWPSGTVDTYYDILADRHVLAHEGTCLSTFFTLQHEGDLILCEGESIEIKVPGDYMSYQWSDGSNAKSVTIDHEADLSVRAIDAQGCVHHSNITRIQYDPDETPEISFVMGGTVNCPGDQVLIESSPSLEYLWSNGHTDQSLEVTEAGEYIVQVTGHCREFTGESVNIQFFEPELPVLSSDTIFLESPAPVILTAEGEEIHWYDSEEADILLALDTFHTDTIFSDTVFFASNRAKHQAEILTVGMKDHMGSPLGGNNLNSGLKFNCWKPMIIEEVKVISAAEGNRTIELIRIDEIDGTEMLIDSRTVFVSTGEQNIALGFEVDSGLNYVLTTNSDSNYVHFGYYSPALYRSNEGVNFPYTIEGIMEMTSSLHGASYYYYFFDWQVRPVSVSCESERVPLYILVDTLSQVFMGSGDYKDIRIFPNPASNELRIHFEGSLEGEEWTVEVFDLLGQRLMMQQCFQETRMDVSQLNPGIYLIWFRQDSKGELMTKKLQIAK